MYKTAIYFILAIIVCSCADSDEATVRDVCRRNPEMARVLEHYADDEEGLRFARFLIAASPENGEIRYNGYGTPRIIRDDTTLTAEFLIENIELARSARRDYPWCSMLSDSVFMNEVLPYRVKNEQLEDWRSHYYHRLKSAADSIAAVGGGIADVIKYVTTRYPKKYIKDAGYMRGDLPYSVVEKMGGGVCSHMALNEAQMLRAIGIAFNIDALPYHGKVNGGHSYNSYYDEKGEFHFMSPYDRDPARNAWIAPKMVRIMFRYPKTLDVTELYYPVSEVELTHPGLCLSTYNRAKLNLVWEGRNEGGKSVFDHVPVSLLYFPTDEELKPSADIAPFILEKDGSMIFLDKPGSGTMAVDSIHIYDVNRIEKVDSADIYTLWGWEKGDWKKLADGKIADDSTLSFGAVERHRLFLVKGFRGNAAIQRPFTIDDAGKIDRY